MGTDKDGLLLPSSSPFIHPSIHPTIHPSIQPSIEISEIDRLIPTYSTYLPTYLALTALTALLIQSSQ